MSGSLLGIPLMKSIPNLREIDVENSHFPCTKLRFRVICFFSKVIAGKSKARIRI